MPILDRFHVIYMAADCELAHFVPFKTRREMATVFATTNPEMIRSFSQKTGVDFMGLVGQPYRADG